MREGASDESAWPLGDLPRNPPPDRSYPRILLIALWISCVALIQSLDVPRFSIADSLCSIHSLPTFSRYALQARLRFCTVYLNGSHLGTDKNLLLPQRWTCLHGIAAPRRYRQQPQ